VASIVELGVNRNAREGGRLAVSFCIDESVKKSIIVGPLPSEMHFFRRYGSKGRDDVLTPD
jgi:hypothetical protein